MGKNSAESSAYAALGASSAKGGVLAAVGETGPARYFANPVDDPAGDPSYAFFLHADGAGTKSIVAYLLFKETGETRWFRSLAIDSLVMNLDDVAKLLERSVPTIRKRLRAFAEATGQAMGAALEEGGTL